MTSTVVDLWRMLADYDSRTVVRLDDCDVTDDVCTTPLVSPSADQFVSRNIQNPARTRMNKSSKVAAVAATQSCRCCAYIFPGVKNVPVDVSAHAPYM